MSKVVLAYAIGPAQVGLPLFTDLGQIITQVLPVIVSLSGLATFAYLVLGGFRYITASGDEKAVQEAKKIITHAVIGLAIVFTAFWAVRIIETVLGLEITGK